MHFNLSTIVISLIFSSVGFVYFSYGKKQSNFNLMAVGMILMLYTYFVSSVPVSLIIGILLTLAPKFFQWF